MDISGLPKPFARPIEPNYEQPPNSPRATARNEASGNSEGSSSARATGVETQKDVFNSALDKLSSKNLPTVEDRSGDIARGEPLEMDRFDRRSMLFSNIPEIAHLQERSAVLAEKLDDIRADIARSNPNSLSSQKEIQKAISAFDREVSGLFWQKDQFLTPLSLRLVNNLVAGVVPPALPGEIPEGAPAVDPFNNDDASSVLSDVAAPVDLEELEEDIPEDWEIEEEEEEEELVLQDQPNFAQNLSDGSGSVSGASSSTAPSRSAGAHSEDGYLADDDRSSNASSEGLISNLDRASVTDSDLTVRLGSKAKISEEREKTLLDLERTVSHLRGVTESLASDLDYFSRYTPGQLALAVEEVRQQQLNPDPLAALLNP